MKNFLKWIGILFGGLIVLSGLAIVALYPSGMKKLTQSYPNIQIENVVIPTGPDAIARGKHVSIIWNCTKCHGESLSGMLLVDDPFLGTIPASNLTSGQGALPTLTPTQIGYALFGTALSQTVKSKSSCMTTSGL